VKPGNGGGRQSRQAREAEPGETPRKQLRRTFWLFDADMLNAIAGEDRVGQDSSRQSMTVQDVARLIDPAYAGVADRTAELRKELAGMEADIAFHESTLLQAGRKAGGQASARDGLPAAGHPQKWDAAGPLTGTAEDGEHSVLNHLAKLDPPPGGTRSAFPGRAERISMDYQPGHPHGFCSAIWMGEVALCRPLYDPQGAIARLKDLTSPYPEKFRAALLKMFLWEIGFSIKIGETAIARGEQTHIAGCVYRALSCVGQILFALNRRYLINEKGALAETARFPCTLHDLSDRVARIWVALGKSEFAGALSDLSDLDEELRALTIEMA